MQLQLLHRHTPIAPEVSVSQRPLAYLVPRWLWDVPLTQGKVLFLALCLLTRGNKQSVCLGSAFHHQTVLTNGLRMSRLP